MAGKESKTEKPTHKRLEDAKKKGDIARSNDLGSTFSLAVALLFIGVSFSWFSGRLVDFWQRQFTSINLQEWSVNFLTATYREGFYLYLMVIAPLFVLLLSAAIFTNMIQGGSLKLHFDNLKFKGSKFNIFKGIKRIMLSVQAITELIKSMIKVSVIGFIAYKIVKAEFTDILTLSSLPLSESFRLMSRLFLKLAGAIILFLLILSILDYMVQKKMFLKKMKMTKQEIKDEYKQMEGDPKIKGKRRQIQFQRAMSRMMEKIPEADVVITNPTHYAVALSYEYQKMRSPVVIAKGKNHIAHKIIERAKEHRIPVIENPPLARGIYANVELNHPIPEEYFRPVAEILAYIYKLKGRRVS